MEGARGGDDSCLTLYLDESGYTGSDLISQSQPVYVLASLSIDDRIAQELVAECFEGLATAEIKHSALHFRSNGRQRVLRFAEALGRYPSVATVTVVHKECVLVGKLIDVWLETALHADGVNLYEQGGNISLMNLTYMVLTAKLGRDGRREFLRRFQVMMRDRTPFAFASFWDSVRELSLDPVVGELFELYEMAGARLGRGFLTTVPNDTLELGDMGLLGTLMYWRKRSSARLRLIHDRTSTLERKKDAWDTLLAAETPPTTVGLDRRTLVFPLRGSVDLADSKSYVQLQLADVIAGAAATVLSAEAGHPPKHPDYVAALKKGPLLKNTLIEGSVWPLSDTLPADLGTDGPNYGDHNAFMAALIEKGREAKRRKRGDKE